LKGFWGTAGRKACWSDIGEDDAVIKNSAENSFLSAGFAFAAGVCVLLRLVVWKFFPSADTVVKEDLSNLLVASLQLCVGAGYFGVAAAGWLKPRLTGFEWPLAGLVLASGISLTYSVDVSMSIRMGISLTGSIVMFYVLANTLTSWRRVLVFLSFILACAWVTSFFGIQEFFYLSSRAPQPGDTNIAQFNNSLYYILTSRRVTSFLGWPNSLAGYIGLILPFSGLLIIMVRPVWLRCLLAGVFATLVGCLLVTFSFLGWLSFLLASVVLFPAVLRHLFVGINPRVKAACWALVGIFMALFLVVICRKNFLGSLAPRLEYYAQAWHLIALKPWFGSGIGTFGIAARSMVTTIAGLTNFVHNSYLQWWLECGVAGLVSIMAFVGVFAVSARRMIQQAVPWQPRIIVIAVVWGLTAFLIDNCFSFTFIKPNIAVHGWALFGVFAALGVQQRPPEDTRAIHRWSLAAGGVVLGALVVVSFCICRALFSYHQASQAFRAGQVDTAGRTFAAASTLDRWSAMYPSAAGDAAVQVFRVSRQVNFLRLAETNYLEAARREPLQYAPQLMLGQIYSALGENDKALSYARSARRLSPYEYDRDITLIMRGTPRLN
jgi:O-antigen ligase